MIIKKVRGSDLVWESLDAQGESWFNAQISLYDFSSIKTSDENVSKTLQNLLKNSVRLNSAFLSKWNGFKVETQLEFDREWGLGSSSTLICLLAEWADVNAFHLFFKVADGSGYDIACGLADGPILYALTDDSLRYDEIEFEPSFRDHLYFVHLNKKVDSNLSVERLGKKASSKKLVSQISKISEKIMSCKSLEDFETLIEEHEQLLSKALGLPRIQDQLFEDYWGQIKSLGAWGGDLVLASSNAPAAETKAYFENKGFSIFIPYSELIL
jgi:mevalonate kinase